jgi:Sortase domain
MSGAGPQRFVIAVVVIVGVLAGCGRDASPSDAENPPRAAAAAGRSQEASDDRPGTRPQFLWLGDERWPIVPVGVDQAQKLEIPNSVNTLGWWRDGARPGSGEGFTVLVGHAVNQGQAAANRWWTLQRGDTLAVGTGGDGVVTYRVRSRSTYSYEDVPLGRWFVPSGPEGPPALALITCSEFRDGDWTANTVVEAVPTG